MISKHIKFFEPGAGNSRSRDRGPANLRKKARGNQAGIAFPGPGVTTFQKRKRVGGSGWGPRWAAGLQGHADGWIKRKPLGTQKTI